MSVQQAIRLAESSGLDLIEVSPNSKPPVCKIANFGKFNYEKQKKEKEQKKNKTGSQVKEIRFHPNTDTHDLDFKCRHLKEFLLEGHKVKATVIFIGRMMVHQDIGKRLLNEVIERLLEVGKIEQEPKMEGRHMTVMLIPEKKKVDQFLKTRNQSSSKRAAKLEAFKEKDPNLQVLDSPLTEEESTEQSLPETEIKAAETKPTVTGSTETSASDKQ